MAIHIAGMRVEHGVDALCLGRRERSCKNLVARAPRHHVFAHDILKAIVNCHGSRKLARQFVLPYPRHIGQALAVGHHVHVANAKVAMQQVALLNHTCDA